VRIARVFSCWKERISLYQGSPVRIAGLSRCLAAGLGWSALCRQPECPDASEPFSRADSWSV
jgi:hypothetical protein